MLESNKEIMIKKKHLNCLYTEVIVVGDSVSYYTIIRLRDFLLVLIWYCVEHGEKNNILKQRSNSLKRLSINTGIFKFIYSLICAHFEWVKSSAIFPYFLVCCKYITWPKHFTRWLVPSVAGCFSVVCTLLSHSLLQFFVIWKLNRKTCNVVLFGNLFLTSSK